eukprot:TRINITY_DN24142_c0_g1_i1.p1 TRINITY_DN24142_c0_g1~~TRINITY_DN24142_c0_g1_i1.p1  ORF type:complete len:615 (+),score=112.35 TRINITY_DN24142_c0_g1_i1:105-1949(+)
MASGNSAATSARSKEGGPVLGEEKIMCYKGHGSSLVPVQDNLRWGCDPNIADELCNFNRVANEDNGYFLSSSFMQEAQKVKAMDFFDSNDSLPIFKVPGKGRSLADFLEESKKYGWPSFRDSEVNWDHVRVLPSGEVVSINGTHLGHQDHRIMAAGNNRYQINLVAIAGQPDVPQTGGLFSFFRKSTNGKSSPTVLQPSKDSYKEDYHFIKRKHRLRPPYPGDFESCVFCAGKFWSVEKVFWQLPGVYCTITGFCGSRTFRAEPPAYYEVQAGKTSYAEAVQVVWDPTKVSFADLLRLFWWCHDPTQGPRQGKYKGGQYRSAIYATDDRHMAAARASKAAFAQALAVKGYGPITTEVRKITKQSFHFAPDEHQQYLPKRAPYNQQCSLQPTGVVLAAFDDWIWAGTGPGRIHACSECRPVLTDDVWSLLETIRCACDDYRPTGNTSQAIAEAKVRTEERKRAHNAELQRTAAAQQVVIIHCGCCWLSQFAKYTADFLNSKTGVRITLIQDIVVTGRFEIQMGHKVLHARSAGDGLIDTPQKLERIVRGLADVSKLTRDPASILAECKDFQFVLPPDPPLPEENFGTPQVPAANEVILLRTQKRETLVGDAPALE